MAVNKIENIPCKYEEHWTENQSPLGSGYYWPEEFSDCGFRGFENEKEQMKYEEYLESKDFTCDKRCPGYEATEVKTCEKHGEFLAMSGCDGCMYDSYIEAEESAKEYYGKVK